MDYLPVIFVALIGLGLGGLLLYRVKKTVTIPPTIPQEGISIPVYNSARGTFLFNVHNGLYPSLRVYEDRVSFTVMANTTVTYGQIKGVDVINMLGLSSLILSFPDKTFQVYLNMNRANLKQVIMLLQIKGCSLSTAAQEFLNN